MTASEACALLVDTIVELSAARREGDSYREIVLVALAQLAQSTARLETARSEIRRLKSALERTTVLLAPRPTVPRADVGTPRAGHEAATVQ